MSKLFVTGGAGFIGSNFIREYIKAHPDDLVVCFDLLTYAGNLDNLSGLDEANFTFIKGDITDREGVEQAMDDSDYVVHFAAESHVTRSEKDPAIFFKTNVEGTKTLLDAAIKAKVKRFIHISTDEVYGPITEGYFKESDKVSGDSQATSPYAKSKSQADDLAQSYMDKLDLIIVRPTNNFGPRQYPEKALPRWITNVLSNEKIPVWGEGRQVRDWLFVGDTFKAIDLILRQGQASEIYNIGANHDTEMPNIEMAKKLVQLLSCTEEMIELVPDPRPQHDFRYGVDSTKLRALGWKPGQFEEQLALTVKWYQDNRSWWTALKEKAEKLYR